MSFIRKAQQTVYEITPAGNHPARCYRIVDLGIQLNDFDKNNPKHERRVMFSWQLTGELMKDGRPFSIDKQYKDSLHEKANLRKMLESYRGIKYTDQEIASGVDYSQVLDLPCLLNVVHNPSGDRVYANIQSISPLPKGLPAPPLTIKPYVFDIEKWDAVVFDGISDYHKEIINFGKANMTRQAEPVATSASASDPATNSFPNDDIPF